MDQEAGGMKYPEWAAFVAANIWRMGKLSPGMVKTWTKGIARPRITRVAAIAKVTGIAESDIIAHAGLGPGGSAAEILEHARKEKNRKTAEWIRNKYRSDESFRDRMNRNTRINNAHKRPVDRFIRIMRAAILDQPKLGKLRAPKRPWSLGRIKQEIACAKAGLRRCEAILSQTWRPWHEDRCASKAIWAKLHPDHFREWQLADWKAKAYRRAQERRAIPGSFTSAEWYDRMREFGYKCAYCGKARSQAKTEGFDLESDHLVSLAAARAVPALARFATNHITNLVPACKSCNSSKSDCWTLSWIIAKGMNVSPLVEKMIYSIMTEACRHTTIAETLWLARDRVTYNRRKCPNSNGI